MNTAEARWRLVVPLRDKTAWDLLLAELSDAGVEGIVEMEDRAEIYFTTREQAEAASAFHGLGAPEMGPVGESHVFGETDHPTTQLCLELMTGALRRGDQVVDIGSGTGRLSTEALRLGARLCVAADVDWPAAVASVESGASVICGSAGALRTAAFDGVLANLHLALWRELAPEIGRIAAPYAWLAASGFLVEQETEAREMLAGLGWLVERTASSEGWLGIVARR